MNKKIKIALITVLAAIAIYFAYNLLFIRTVNYQIGGYNIPSKYNVLTGKVSPIKNYKGKEPKQTIVDRKSGKLRLDKTGIVAAQVRWAVFEEWVKARPEYKGWDSDTEMFKKAQSDFLTYMAKSGRKINIIK